MEFPEKLLIFTLDQLPVRGEGRITAPFVPAGDTPANGDGVMVFTSCGQNLMSAWVLPSLMEGLADASVMGL